MYGPYTELWNIYNEKIAIQVQKNTQLGIADDNSHYIVIFHVGSTYVSFFNTTLTGGLVTISSTCVETLK
jgi:hypothetical protein